ncbi:DUF3090 domain-containing protein [Brevibacterium ihuae]|uniref:DUF3090 domain-containing protein n=1 Tax=Brevibacterium ihuae TaxID=1631743 RepID=UPI000C7679A0|nr:DUF3090 domain-containing protein [Brevibacterium ihuae]
MPPQVFDHSAPDRFVVGTVGLPGERTFFLQARTAERITTVVLEKEQVEMLGERVNELLDLVRSKSSDPRSIPLQPREDLIDNAGLSVPVEAEFRVGTMSLGWDTVAEHMVIECFEFTQEDAESGTSADPDEAEDRDRLRVVLGAAQAREFSRRADQVVGAGRQDCPFCSLPLDADGHMCPRANGVAR